MSEQTIFTAALEREPALRCEFLDQACGDDVELRQRIEMLLRLHAESGGFLEQPAAAEIGLTAHDPIVERPGTQIGPYKLLQQLGEGGMGVVYLAEQLEPVKRRVALKIIKPGMDTWQVIARFEAERQALALMDHPNIAKVLDAGTTQSGRPYFVMELVNGQPITQYCDDHHLPPRQRLELFVPVCQAIQHAHQKGIIHRDIKPSNVMVTLYDGQPVPKVIDFGVAKATEQKLTEQTLFTQHGAMVGTLEYMSPEQAEMSALGVDTRSDIYSLGVLLYELLTGSTPLSRQQMKDAAFGEILRLIKEEEPPRPSTRLSDSGAALASISALRQTEPAKLSKLMRGELDWIVMKTLEKDRNRRYETANGFAADIQRYLTDEPVEACPPSASYRLQKFAQRNRAAALTITAILLALVAGIAGTTFGLIRAEHRRADAEEARGNEAAQRLIADEQTKKAERAEADALADFRASTDDAIEQLIGSKANLGPQEKAYLENTLKRWQAFAARQGDDQRSRAIRAEGHHRVAYLWGKLGRRQEACTEYETARELYQKLSDDFPAVPRYQQDLALAHNNLGAQLFELGQHDAAIKEYEAARDLRRKLTVAFPDVPEYQRNLATSHNSLGSLLNQLGRRDAARVEYETARDLFKKIADTNPTVPHYQQGLAHSHNNLGGLLYDMGQFDLVGTEYETARDLFQKLADDFPDVIEYQEGLAVVRNQMGLYLVRIGRHDTARIEYETARDLFKKLADTFPAVPRYQSDLARTHSNLGLLLIRIGERDAAVMEYESALNLRKKLAEAFAEEREYQVALGGGYCNFGNLFDDDGRPSESLPWFDLAIRTLTPVFEQDRREVTVKEFLRNSHLGRSRAYKRLKNYAEAAMDLDKAIELDPHNPQLYNERGNDLSDQNIPNQAAVAYQKAIDVDPKYVYAYVNLGRALYHQKKLDEAVAAYRKAIEVDPKVVATYINLSRALYEQKKLDEAIASYRQAIEVDPNSLDAHYGLGFVLRVQNKYDEAIVAFRTLVKLDPTYAGAYTNLGFVLKAQGKLDEAVDCYRKAIELEPKSARASINLALALQAQKKAYEAVAAFRKAIELDSQNSSTLNGKPNTAEGIDLPTWMACASSLVQAEDTEGYHKLCDRLLERFGQSRDVDQIAFLAHICVLAPNALADSARVVQLAEQRSALTTDIEAHKHWSMHVLGLAYYRAGQVEQAVARLQAGQKDPGLTTEVKMSNWLVLAMCLKRQGQDGEAASALQTAQVILASAEGEPHRENRVVQILFHEAEALLREQ